MGDCKIQEGDHMGMMEYLASLVSTWIKEIHQLRSDNAAI
jgi:hypothetical protein